MHQPKEIYVKNLFFALFICVLALFAFLMPNFINSKPSNNAGGFVPSFSTSPTGNPPATFSSTTTLTEKAETLTGAMATVKIINNSTNSAVGIGSGVAVADEGYLVTNYHVIYYLDTNPTKYSIMLDMQIDGVFTQNVPANLVWFNASLDIAILKSSQTFDVYVNMENRWIDSTNPLKVAEEIWTLGTPFDDGLFASFSKGTISSNSPRIELTSVNNKNYLHNYLIQHNAAISSGSSGGALFDMNGNLVGLNTCGKTSTSNNIATNLFFAVPIYPVMIVLNKAISGDKTQSPYTTPVLGVTSYDKDYQTLGSSYTFAENGVFILEVVPTSDAAAKGLCAEDIIVGMGDENCLDKNHSSYFQIDRTYDLVYSLIRYNSGDTVSLFYKNSLGTHRIVIELG